MCGGECQRNGVESQRLSGEAKDLNERPVSRNGNKKRRAAL